MSTLQVQLSPLQVVTLQQQNADTETDFNIEKNVLLVPTYALVLRLVVQLPKLKFCIHLDNLFLNVSVVQCLLVMNIYCMETIRKKTIDVSIQL